MHQFSNLISGNTTNHKLISRDPRFLSGSFTSRGKHFASLHRTETPCNTAIEPPGQMFSRQRAPTSLRAKQTKQPRLRCICRITLVLLLSSADSSPLGDGSPPSSSSIERRTARILSIGGRTRGEIRDVARAELQSEELKTGSGGSERRRGDGEFSRVFAARFRRSSCRSTDRKAPIVSKWRSTREREREREREGTIESEGGKYFRPAAFKTMAHAPSPREHTPAFQRGTFDLISRRQLSANPRDFHGKRAFILPDRKVYGAVEDQRELAEG